MGCGVYFINSGFKIMLEIERILYHTNYSDIEKQARSLKLFYPVVPEEGLTLPKNLNEAFVALIDFRNQKNKRKYNYIEKNEPSTLCYELDSDAIYADFLREYHIDLNENNIHWYKFLALLSNLSSGSSLNNIRGWRSKKTDGMKTNSEEFRHTVELKQVYKIEESVQDVHSVFNKTLYAECVKTGDYARYAREKRG